MQESGELLLAAGLDGGNSLNFSVRKNCNESPPGHFNSQGTDVTILRRRICNESPPGHPPNPLPHPSQHSCTNAEHVL